MRILTALLSSCAWLVSGLVACSEPPQQHRGPSDPREATARPIVPDHRLVRKTASVRNPEVFPWYIGPEAIPSFKPGDRVWTPTPVGRTWDIINLAVATVDRIDGNLVHLKAGVLEFSVPAAVLLPAAAPAKLANRAPVLACLGLAGEWGRVVSVDKESVTVALVLAQTVVTRDVTPERVLPLTGKGGAGHPVAFHRGESIGFGMLLYLNREKAGVITYTGKLELVNPDQVRFVSLDKTPVRNAAMWASFADTLEEVRILQVLEHDAAVEVLFPLRPQEPLINPRIISSARVTKLPW